MKGKYFISCLLLLLPIMANAYDAEVKGIYYNLDKTNKTAEVVKGSFSYEDDIVIPESFTYGNDTYKVVSIGESAFENQPVTSVNIPNSVTNIGFRAFERCGRLSIITIPNSVKKVGDHAFRECNFLSSVKIGNGLTSLGKYIFFSCPNLSSITFSDGLTSIDEKAFAGCSSLTSITFPESLTSICDGAFADCANLNLITLPESLRFIGSYAFGNCLSLTSVSIPEGVTEVSSGVFDGCDKLDTIVINGDSVASMVNLKVRFGNQIKKYIISEGVDTIGVRSFYEAENLTEVILPNTLKSIGRYAFADCKNLQSITIPDNTTLIEEYAFSGCSSLTSVTLSNGLTTLGKNAFEDCTSLAEVEVPNGITTIGDNTFSGCTSLSSVTFQKGLTAIVNEMFKQCTSLSSIILPEGVVSIGKSAFKGCSALASLTISKTVSDIGSSAFEGCTSLSSVTINSSYIVGEMRHLHQCFGEQVTEYIIGEGIETIGKLAFDGCENLTSVVLPSTITLIGESAFGDCTGLAFIKLSEGITNIEGYAFENCANLASISLPQSLISIGTGAFMGCSSLPSITIPERVVSLGTQAFANCSALTSIIVPESVRSIGSDVFSGCSNLTSITIPKGVKEFGGPISPDCPLLTTVTVSSDVILLYSFDSSLKDFFGYQVTKYIIGEGVEEIGDYTFAGCSSTIEVVLPKTLKSIGAYAFRGCSNLSTITLPDNITTIGENAFQDCIALTSINIPRNITKLANYVFWGCSGLESVNFPEELISIGEQVFDGASSLRSVSIPKNVNSIGVGAFNRCSSLVTVTINSNDYISKEFDYYKKLSNIFGKQVSKYIIGEGVEKVGENAFWECEGLTSVVLFEGVTTIGQKAFYQCTNLTSVTLPESLITIEEEAFNGCSSLASVVIPKGVQTMKEAYSSGWTMVPPFANCPLLKTVTINSNALASKSSIGAYFGPQVTKFILGEGIEELGFNAFSNCNNLTSIVLPSSLRNIGTGAFSRCTNLSSITLPKNLTSIGANAFDFCTNLTSVIFEGYTGSCSIAIPESVNSIQNYAFFECPLSSVVIYSNDVASMQYTKDYNLGSIFSNNVKNIIFGDNITAIGDYACYNDYGLESVIIPNSVTSIGENAFYSCSNLTSVDLPNNITQMGLIPFNYWGVDLLVDRVSKTVLSLWSWGYRPIDRKTLESLPATSIIKLSSTQTTVTFLVSNVYPEYETTLNGEPIEEGEFTVTGLIPEEFIEYYLKVALEDHVYTSGSGFETSALDMKVISVPTTTTIWGYGYIPQTDAKVVDYRMRLRGTGDAYDKVIGETDNQKIELSGLEPNTEYVLDYIAVVAYGENGKERREYTHSEVVRTGDIVFNTLAPKVVSPGEVVVSAETNITNENENVGFEWRRTDAPEELASKSGEAFLFEGTMEGILHNLNSFSYWRFRPYYVSSSGQKYYGDWGIVEADDYSYFEPTVHTYANIEVDSNTAEMKGYVMRGTDNVESQGFMYWKKAPNASADGRMRASVIPSNAKSVTAEGTQMRAKLKDLDFDTEYSYVAYVTTSKNQTFYGEEQSFKTDMSQDMIDGVDGTNATDDVIEIARYDLNGRKLSAPQRGINIIRMSDGTSRKVMVK